MTAHDEQAGISTQLVSAAATACLEGARHLLHRGHHGEVSDYEVLSFLCMVGTEMSARMIFEGHGGTPAAENAVETANDRLRQLVHALEELNRRH